MTKTNGALAPDNTNKPNHYPPLDFKTATDAENEAHFEQERVKGLISDTMHAFFPGLAKSDEQEALIQAARLINRLNQLNERYAVALVSGKAVILDMYSIKPPVRERIYEASSEIIAKCLPDALTPESLKLMYKPDKVTTYPFAPKPIKDKDGTVLGWHDPAPKEVSIGDIWLEWKGRQEYPRGITFAPGASEGALPPGMLNLFTNWGMAPTKGPLASPKTKYTQKDREEDEAGCSLFLKHIHEVVCDDDAAVYEWVLWWMADIFQNPRNRQGSAIVLQGEKGCGKSIVADVLNVLIGDKHFARASKKKDLVGSFNGHLAGKLAINCEEATFGGDTEADNSLKHMITGKTLTINEKFLPQFDQPAHARFIFTTNGRYSHNTDRNERRYLFLDCADYYVKNRLYFKSMMDQLTNEDGYQCLANLLFNLYRPDGVDLGLPPTTKGHARLTLESLSVEERYFINAVIDGEDYPLDAKDAGGMVYIADVKRDYKAWLEERGKGSSLKLSDTSWVTACMEKFWQVDLESKKLARRNGRNSTRETAYFVQNLSDSRVHLQMPTELSGFNLPAHLFVEGEEE